MSDPQKLGKYEVRRQLGSGAMGIVYEGYDPFIQRTVALKTIRKELLDRERAQEMLARFQREAQAGGRLSHPNIVAIYDYGEDQDTAYIAMEFIEGKELKELFAECTRFTLAEIVDIMAQLLSALTYSHQHGVVHRDIKPANIIVMADGKVKVADFGIARLESSNLTQTGSIMGTPNYMSPEQFMGQSVDGRSDLFSAGVVLYQLLTGEKPFLGESTTTIMYQVLNNTPNAPSVLNVQIPPAFDGITRKALAKRPADRFQTGQEFIDAIKSAAEGKPFYSDVESTIPVLKPADIGAKSAEPGIAAPSTAAPAGTNMKLRIGGAAIAALAIIGGIVSLTRSPAPPEPPKTLVQENAGQASAVQAAAPEATGPQKKTAAAQSTKKLPQKKTATEPTAQVAEQTAKGATPEPPPHAPPAATHQDVPPAPPPQNGQAKPPEKKKGIFGEELKPSLWRKEGDLL